MPEIWGAISGIVTGGFFFWLYWKAGKAAINFSKGKRMLWLGFFLPLRYFCLAALACLALKIAPAAFIPFLAGIIAGNLIFRIIYLTKGAANGSPG